MLFEIIGFGVALMYAVGYLLIRGVGIVNERENRIEEAREAQRDLLKPYERILQFDRLKLEEKWRTR